MPAYWWVKLDPGPMVGRAMSGAYLRGGCGLRKSLGYLSANGQSSVPILLIVWLEVSQDWSLQAVWVGPGLANDSSKGLAVSLQQEFIPRYVHHHL